MDCGALGVSGRDRGHQHRRPISHGPQSGPGDVERVGVVMMVGMIMMVVVAVVVMDASNCWMCLAVAAAC